jgi:hypothetical protein
MIRFFISSTFLDFQRERDVLQRRVFPVLRQQCAEAGFRFQPIDLRWGISQAAGAERQTLRICLEELAHCQDRSPDFSLLILLGDRYGTCFLPPDIPEDQIIRLRPYLDQRTQARFEAVYVLDENAAPATYVLRHPTERSGRWKRRRQATQEEMLRLTLAQAAQLAGFRAICGKQRQARDMQGRPVCVPIRPT